MDRHQYERAEERQMDSSQETRKLQHLKKMVKRRTEEWTNTCILYFSLIVYLNLRLWHPNFTQIFWVQKSDVVTKVSLYFLGI